MPCCQKTVQGFSCWPPTLPLEEESERLIPTTVTFKHAFLFGERGSGLCACGG